MARILLLRRPRHIRREFVGALNGSSQCRIAAMASHRWHDHGWNSVGVLVLDMLLQIPKVAIPTRGSQAYPSCSISALGR